MREVAETIELAGTLPEVNVLPEEYGRLLGYPRGWVLEGRARELADWARDWYRKNGRPWFYVRQAESLEIVGDSIGIDGVRILEQAFAEARFRMRKRIASFWRLLERGLRLKMNRGGAGKTASPTNIFSWRSSAPRLWSI